MKETIYEINFFLKVIMYLFKYYRVKLTPTSNMSANQWSLAPASAAGLLTENECSMLLDADFFDTNEGKLITLTKESKIIKIKMN